MSERVAVPVHEACTAACAIEMTKSDPHALPAHAALSKDSQRTLSMFSTQLALNQYSFRFHFSHTIHALGTHSPHTQQSLSPHPCSPSLFRVLPCLLWHVNGSPLCVGALLSVRNGMGPGPRGPGARGGAQGSWEQKQGQGQVEGKGQGTGSCTLDLHSLHVGEALAILKRELDARRAAPRSSREQQQVRGKLGLSCPCVASSQDVVSMCSFLSPEVPPYHIGDNRMWICGTV